MSPNTNFQTNLVFQKMILHFLSFEKRNLENSFDYIQVNRNTLLKYDITQELACDDTKYTLIKIY